MKNNKPKVLIIDIETFPLEVYCWGLFDQNISLGQVKQDWSLLSFAAKWLDDPESKIIYADQRNVKNKRDDKKLCEKIWKLLDEADIVVGQNSKEFDIKKINARFLLNGLPPPSGFNQHDTKKMASKYFEFTSNKLEYMSTHINEQYTKQKTSGFSLWIRCLNGDLKAYKEIEHYNKYDVLATEELFKKLSPWDRAVNYNVYVDIEDHTCSCGSQKFRNKGIEYTSVNRYTRYVCKSCGKSVKGNLIKYNKKRNVNT